MKLLIFLLIGGIHFLTSICYAEMAVGGYIGMTQGQPTDSESELSTEGKRGSEFGALFLAPVFPSLSFRLGLAQKTRNTHLSYHGTTAPFINAYGDFSETLLDLALGVQWDLPVTDLYVLGGVKVSSSQEITCDNVTPGTTFSDCKKSDTSYPIFAGVGYNLFDFPFARLAIEGEYEMPSANKGYGEIKHNAYSVKALLKFGI